VNRRSFLIGLAALLAGCGGEGPSAPVLVPSPEPQGPSPQPDENSPAFGSLSYEDGDYVVRDSNGTTRLWIGTESLEGSHVVEADRVTVYYANGSSIVIGRF
jgi:hypothetical protein